jgi:hypothetical protein
MVKFAPHLDDPRFAPLVRSFGMLTLKIGDASDALRNGPILNSDGELRSSLDVLQRLISAQTKLAKELGLTPMTLRSISREKGVDLAGMLAGGDEAEVVTEDERAD